jgi:hypothetical protein
MEKLRDRFLPEWQEKAIPLSGTVSKIYDDNRQGRWLPP